ncbi:hypothetical protein CEXT_776711 [Caerostris extrusa]|uniref:Uncharacterized protein n=1 Tax=Caerostris extrusa TaxID=172846 RepID=A0AAV4WFI9_CAEEX|nr:hypothetical protein CEXT_776711 [Caerostris extrusa]
MFKQKLNQTLLSPKTYFNITEDWCCSQDQKNAFPSRRRKEKSKSNSPLTFLNTGHFLCSNKPCRLNAYIITLSPHKFPTPLHHVIHSCPMVHSCTFPPCPPPPLFRPTDVPISGKSGRPQPLPILCQIRRGRLLPSFGRGSRLSIPLLLVFPYLLRP